MSRFIIFLSVVLACMACNRTNQQIGRAYVVKYDKNIVALPKENLIIKPDYLKQFVKQSQYFFIDPLKDTILQGREGTTIYISASCFTGKDGMISTGKIRVELKELFSIRDIILSNKPTVSDGKILETAGQIYINAFQGNSPLKLSCPEGLSFSIPSSDLKYDMKLFIGRFDTRGNINWQLDSGLVMEPIVMNDFIGEEEYEGYYLPETVSNYFFKSNQLGWINCDRFVDYEGEKTDLIVKVENPMPLEYKTTMFLVFKNIKSVMPVYTDNNEYFTCGQLPIGEEVVLVTVSASENACVFSCKDMIVEKGKIEKVKLETVSKSKMEEELAKLS